MLARGVGGELRHGYQIAARLAEWKMTAVPKRGLLLQAEIASSHSHWLAQRPLDIIVRLGTATWEWRNIEPDVAGAKLELKLSRQPDAVTR